MKSAALVSIFPAAALAASCAHLARNPAPVPPAPEPQVVQAAPAAEGGAAKEKEKVKEDVLKVKLPSGLTVIVKESRSAPVVAIQAWVRAGSADEDEGSGGIAHLHEHMLFKGTKKRPVGRIARDVEASGGEINAWTSFDETVYHIVMASRFFDKGLDILSDAVTSPAFDAAELEKEKEVVIEEIRHNRDIPQRRVMEELFSLAFTRHPYRRPVIGTAESVKAVTREKMLEFYRKHYTPPNTFVVVVGDVDAARTVEAVKEAFKDYGGDAPARTREPDPPMTASSHSLVREKVVEVQFAAGWKIPPFNHPDTPLLDLLAVIVGQGESSWLAREVRRGKGLANDVHTFSYTPADPGLFVLSAGIPASKTRPALEEIYRVFYRAAFRKVSEGDLEKAKSILLADAVYQKETVQGLARKLGYLELVAGDLSFEEKYNRAVMQATPEDLLKAASKYLGAENMAVTAVMPDEKTDPALADFREKDLLEPARAAVSSLSRISEAQAGGAQVFHKKMKNGINLVVQQDRSLPVVAARAVFLGGTLFETPRTSGISSMIARMLTRGTGRRSAADIARESDSMAGSLGGFSGRNSIGLRGEFLSRHLDAGLKMFLDCLTDPRFPEKELEKERLLVVEEIRNKEDDPGTLAADLFARTLFEDHPYGMDVMGTEKTVSSFTAGSLLEFYRRHLTPQGLTLVVVGDADPQEVAELVEEGTAGWDPGQPAVRKAGAPVRPGPREAVSSKDKEQAHIMLGFPGTTLGSGDRYAVEVLAAMLGGQSGRLFLELREKRSMAYTVTAFAMEGLDPGYFAVYMACAPEKTDEALGAVKAELERFNASGAEPAEAERARNYLIGAQEISMQRVSARAAQMAFNEAYGLGYDETFRYAERISAVDAAALREAAARYITPDKAVTAVIRPGNGEKDRKKKRK